MERNEYGTGQRSSSSGTPTAQQSRAGENHNAQGMAQEAAGVMEETKQEVMQAARETRDEAMRRGQQFSSQQKERAVGELKLFGDAVRQAAERLQEEGHRNVASYAHAAADEFDRAARYLENKDFVQLRHDISSFARRRPEIFLGGMFIAGLAASRFLKASTAPRGAADEPWDMRGGQAQTGTLASDSSAAYETDFPTERNEFEAPGQSVAGAGRQPIAGRTPGADGFSTDEAPGDFTTPSATTEDAVGEDASAGIRRPR